MGWHDDWEEDFYDNYDEYEPTREAKLPVTTVLSETTKAWLVLCGGEEIWFPKSRCQLNLTESVIWIPEWLADVKGIDTDLLETRER